MLKLFMVFMCRSKILFLVTYRHTRLTFPPFMLKDPGVHIQRISSSSKLMREEILSQVIRWPFQSEDWSEGPILISSSGVMQFFAWASVFVCIIKGNIHMYMHKCNLIVQCNKTWLLKWMENLVKPRLIVWTWDHGVYGIGRMCHGWHAVPIKNSYFAQGSKKSLFSHEFA